MYSRKESRKRETPQSLDTGRFEDVAQTVVPAARVIPSQTIKVKLSGMAVASGNDDALATGIAVAAMIQLFVLKRPRTLVRQGPYSSTALKKMHTS